MESIVLFGGSGFVGSHLTNLLGDLYQTIYIADIREPGWHKPGMIKNPRMKFVKCDVRNPIDDTLFDRSVSCIVNLAAVHTSPGHPAHEYFEANIWGAKNICAFAEKRKINKIIFTSSISVYGPGEDEKNEESLYMPNIPYGSSKTIAEYIHREWYNREQGRTLSILRPGVIFGMGEGGNFTRIANMLQKGFFPFPGRTDTVKACLYVKDIAEFIIQQCTQGTGYSYFNFCYQKKYSTNDIVSSFKRTLGYKAFTPLIPLWFVNFGASVVSFIRLPFFSRLGLDPDRIIKLVKSTNISSEKLYNSGFKFKYDLDSALKDWASDCNGRRLF
jgi:nucleoside-diphosphate-sugar epimerase